MAHSYTLGEMPDGRPVDVLVCGQSPGVEAHICALGASVHRIAVDDARGVRREVALSAPTVAARLASEDYLGSVVGRYANRIAHGSFQIDGTHFSIPVNDRGHACHGGPEGFDRRLWRFTEARDDAATLSLVSPDGDMGFPGGLTVTAAYQVSADAVQLTLTAETDRATLVNLTSHTYLNLDGDGSGGIEDHDLSVTADEYTPVDATGIPLGPHRLVEGSPFDLRQPTRIGRLMRSVHPELQSAGGLDHNFVIRGRGLRTAAVLASRRSGLVVDLQSTAPGLQVYTGNYLETGRYRRGGGIALEPQLHPDSPHHPGWPSAVLRPGDRYTSTIRWTFRRR